MGFSKSPIGAKGLSSVDPGSGLTIRGIILSPEREHQENTKGMGDGPLLPKERGARWADDHKVLSGIIHVTQRGLRWVDAPAIESRNFN